MIKIDTQVLEVVQVKDEAMAKRTVVVILRGRGSLPGHIQQRENTQKPRFWTTDRA